MATQEDSNVEGVTSFPSTPTTSYRFIIFLRRGKLLIWLEDRSSKKRWQTSFLRKDEYITEANVFANATPTDYALLFKQSLDCSLGGNGDVQRKLTCLQDDTLRLELCTRIRVLNSSRSIRYVFELQPLVVDRLDILESKLHDQQEMLAQFSSRVNAISIPDPLDLYAESEAQLQNSRLVWKPIDNPDFVLAKRRLGIKVLTPGLYTFGVLVNHIPRTHAIPSVSLQKNNDAIIQRVVEGSANFETSRVESSHPTSTSLLCTARVNKGDQIAVICTNTTLAPGFAGYFSAVHIMK